MNFLYHCIKFSFKQMFVSVLAFVFLLSAFNVEASHSVGADLTYTCVGNDTYEISLTFYRDCFSSTEAPGVGGSILPEINIISATCGLQTTIALTPVANTDGSLATEISPICEGELANSTCNGGPLQGVEQYTYTGVYTFPQKCKDWILSYSLCCRNAAITNSIMPSEYELYVESLLNNLSVDCNNSPVFTTPPVPYICAGQPFNYNHGVYDVEGDSLVYSLIDPLNAPNDPVPYITGLDPTYPITTTPVNDVFFDIDSGQMELTPNNIQIGIVAVLVKEYRNGQLIGSTIRDMQVVVINCMNNVPTPDVPTNVVGGQFDGSTFQVCAGNTLSFDITVEDQDINDVLNVIDNLATSIPEASLSVTGTNPITASFEWATTSDDVGNHSFATIIEDDACPIVGFQVFGYEIFVPGVKITASDTLLCLGMTETIQLDANQIGSLTSGTYTWSPTTGLNNPNIKNPIATIDNSITYTVLYDDGVCMVSNEVTIQIEGTIQVSDATICAGQSAQLEAIYVPTVPVSSDICSAISANCANNPTTFTIGTGLDSTGPTNTDDEAGTPYHGYFHDGRTQYLYSAADLNVIGLSAGLITELALEVSVLSSTRPYDDFTISMGCTNIITFQNNDDFTPNLEQVYTETITPSVGWNTYIFDTPYLWDGTSNLLVEICFNNDNWSSFDHVFYTQTSYNSVLYGSKDNDTGCFIDAEETSDRRPNTQFTICELEPTLNIDFAWLPTTGLSDPNIPNPIASPDMSTTYTVTATTPDGCEVTETVEVIIGELGVTASGTTVACGGTSGTIDVEVSGGVEPYVYDWDNDALDGIEDPTGLAAGTYNLTVTDLNGCQNTAQAMVTINASISATALVDTLACFGNTNGKISLTIEGGTEPYTFDWDNAPDVQNPDELGAGTYQVSITDAGDCTIQVTAVITQPDELTVSIDNVVGTSCGSTDNGRADALVAGGTPPFSFLWDNNETTPSANMLAQGNQNLSITDANGCIVQATVNIPSASGITAQISTTPTTCYADNDGTISINASGGAPPYTYSLNGETYTANPELSQLTGGTYEVYIQDAVGCIIIETAIVGEAPELVIDIIENANINFGDSIILETSVSQGIGATYTWSSLGNLSCIDCLNPTVEPSYQTAYTLNVVTDDGCKAEASVTIFVDRNQPVFIPNAFTPNGDNVNDVFMVHGNTAIQNVHIFRIFDRWGEVLFENQNTAPNNPENGWDGTSKGQELNPGVYIYYIEVRFIDGTTLPYSGELTLIR